MSSYTGVINFFLKWSSFVAHMYFFGLLLVGAENAGRENAGHKIARHEIVTYFNSIVTLHK